MLFTLVHHLFESGVVWTFGHLPVIRLTRRVGRVVSEGPSGKETDLQPFKKDETKHNTTRACHLLSFVISPNLGSLKCSVVPLSPIYWGGEVSGRDGRRDGRRRMQSGTRETKRDETWHRHVVYPRFCSPQFGCRLDCQLACRLPFAIDPIVLTL